MALRTATFALYINTLVCTAETDIVYCEVRTEFLYHTDKFCL